jgi:deoxyribonuclease V
MFEDLFSLESKRRSLSELKKPKEFSIKKARKLQDLLSTMAVTEDRLPRVIRYVGGVDVAYTSRYAIAAAVVLSYPSLEIFERKVVRTGYRFPYIPTLLSFREGPAVCKVICELKLKPDVYLIEGHGRAHPYRCGLATHVGVVMRIPTIGVAKGLLCGRVRRRTGKWVPIIDKSETIGAAVTTISGVKPVYVSVGNMVSLNRAIDIVLHCVKKNRIPEPIRIAHITAGKEK